MTDLIDRAALLADIEEAVVFSGRPGQNAEVRGANKIIDRIKAAPAVDAVEVVRCIECKSAYLITDKDLCCLYDHDMIFHPHSHYCSYGERRTNEADRR